MASLRRIANGLRLVLAVQWRCRFPVIYAALGMLSVVALRFVPLLYDVREQLLPAIHLIEYGTLPLMMVAAHRSFERNERSVTALVVTPLSGGEYALSLALGSALVPTAVALGLQVGVMGPTWSALLLPVPLLLTATFSGLLSFSLSTRHVDFTRFLLVSFIPAQILLVAPLLAWFGLAPRFAFVWLPTDAAVFAFGSASAAPLDVVPALWAVGWLALWNVCAFLWARGTFQSRVRGQLEYA